MTKNFKFSEISIYTTYILYSVFKISHEFFHSTIIQIPKVFLGTFGYFYSVWYRLIVPTFKTTVKNLKNVEIYRSKWLKPIFKICLQGCNKTNKILDSKQTVCHRCEGENKWK